jgi:hypothetical protein
MRRYDVLHATARTLTLALLVSAGGAVGIARGQAWGLPEMSAETKACVECHKTANVPI